MSRLAVDMFAFVPIDRVVPDQNDGSRGDEVSQEEDRQDASKFECRPGSAGENALVGGAVSGREVLERAEDVGDGSPPGGQKRSGQECREACGGRLGESRCKDGKQRSRFGW